MKTKRPMKRKQWFSIWVVENIKTKAPDVALIRGKKNPKPPTGFALITLMGYIDQASITKQTHT